MYTHVYIRINKVIVRVIHFLESNFRNKYFVGGGGGANNFKISNT